MRLPVNLSAEEQRSLCEYWGQVFGLFSKPLPDDDIPDGLLNFSYNQNEEQIFFAGSFNPFHLGHLECMKLLNRPVTIVPDSSPWKTDSIKKTPFSVLMQISGLLKGLDYNLYPGFLSLSPDQGNPTVDWVSNLVFPKVSLLMGADTFIQMDKWKNYEQLFYRLFSLYVCGRNIDENELNKKKSLFLKKNPNLVIHFLGSHEHEELSSTKLRNLNKSPY